MGTSGGGKSIYHELALDCSKNECARTDTVFFPISQVCRWLFEFFLVLSQLEFLTFVAIWGFESCHNLSFWVWALFKFLSFVTIWLFKDLSHLSVLSQFGFLSFVTNFVFELCHNWSFFIIVTIWSYELCNKFELLSFVTMSVFQWSLFMFCIYVRNWVILSHSLRFSLSPNVPFFSPFFTKLFHHKLVFITKPLYKKTVFNTKLASHKKNALQNSFFSSNIWFPTKKISFKKIWCYYSHYCHYWHHCHYCPNCHNCHYC